MYIYICILYIHIHTRLTFGILSKRLPSNIGQKTIKNHPKFDTLIFESIAKVRRVCSVLEWGTVQSGLFRANNLEFSIGMGKGSVLSCSNFFDIVDLNRDVEASIEFFCSSVCFMWNGEPFSMVFVELTI